MQEIDLGTLLTCNTNIFSFNLDYFALLSVFKKHIIALAPKGSCTFDTFEKLTPVHYNNSKLNSKLYNFQPILIAWETYNKCSHHSMPIFCNG